MSKIKFHTLPRGGITIPPLAVRDRYRNTSPPSEGKYSILTLPLRGGIEILPLSVRVSIGMFSAHIKENGDTSLSLEVSI